MAQSGAGGEDRADEEDVGESVRKEGTQTAKWENHRATHRQGGVKIK